jgi:hypothetical protein
MAIRLQNKIYGLVDRGGNVSLKYWKPMVYKGLLRKAGK